MGQGTGASSVCFPYGDAVAGSAWHDGRNLVDHWHFWNGGILGQQEAAGAGNSHGPRSAAHGSVTGSVGTRNQVAGLWFRSRIAPGNPGESRAGFYRVSGNSARSAGIGWSCAGHGVAGAAGYVDSGATRPVDRSSDSVARRMNGNTETTSDRL